MGRRSSTAGVILGSLACLLLVNLDSAAAKRGCTAFGHSCFGGHGKRSDLEMGAGGAGAYSPYSDLPGARFQLQLGTDGAPDAAPDSAPDAALTPFSSRTLIGRPGINLSPLLKQWLQTYRRSGDADSKKK